MENHEAVLIGSWVFMEEILEDNGEEVVENANGANISSMSH